jgi:hypothetical protein
MREIEPFRIRRAALAMNTGAADNMPSASVYLKI